MMGTRVIVPGRNVLRRSRRLLNSAPNFAVIWTAVFAFALAGPAHGDPDLPSINTNLIFDVTNTVYAGGALRNGSANSAAAIQAAINAASASIVGGVTGGSVRLPANGTLSTYLSGPITMKSSVNLLGDTGR